MVLVRVNVVSAMLLLVVPLGQTMWTDSNYDQSYYSGNGPSGSFMRPTAQQPQRSAVASVPRDAPSHIFVFGDSLSDTGSAFIVNGMINPDPQFYHDAEKTYFGRFSNGKIWVDHLADLVQGSGVIVKSYAFANSQVVRQTLFNPNAHDNEQFPRVIFGNEQVERFIEDSQHEKYENAIAVLWFGSNDIMQPFLQGTITSEESLQAVIDAATEHIRNLAAALQNAGVKRVFYFNLLDFDKIINWRAIMSQGIAKLRTKGHEPVSLAEAHSGFQGLSPIQQRQLAHIYSPYTRHHDVINPSSQHEAGTKMGLRSLVTHKRLLSKAAERFNEALKQNGIGERDIVDITTEFNRLYDGNLRNPSTNRRFETGGSCLTQNAMRHIVRACDNPDSYLLWDEKHPSSAVHNVFALEFYTKLTVIYTSLPARVLTAPAKRPNAAQNMLNSALKRQ